ncbi:putative sulfate exporter family transporter [Microbacterium sp. STN6]|uniref:YeiH family protein n=1 Tax=Microbacterium sp. STN6 TaxID=2995588 RepID=UPI0022608551|nr:putative sulfate exporter family transporter [Microbacterium sp. STN6]MCX7521996.1 putative sulfate exporter family transporter [Microbacterium sp. STN6]
MPSALRIRLPGLALAAAIAVVATVIGHLIPLIGGPVSGIVIGVVLGLFLKPGPVLSPGVKTASKFVLQLSVVVLGSQLSLAEIARAGVESLPVMLGTLVVCLVGAWLIGRWLGVVGNLRTLVGVGTGICGASAIAAVTPVIGAVGAEVAYAVSTIFLFNVAAVLLFPFIGHLLGLSQHAFGLFAGTAINDTSSVVAAATTYGSEAANYAVVVKLVRTLMIIPISLGLAALVGRRERRLAMIETADAAAAPGTEAAPHTEAAPGTEAALGTATSRAAAPGAAALDPEARRRPRVHVFRLVPWFLIGFVVIAAVNSLGVIPAAAHPALSQASVFLITMALSAIGLSTDIAGFRRAGARPLILGGCLWLLVSLTSLGLQFATGLM